MNITRPGGIPAPQMFDFVEVSKSYEKQAINQYTDRFYPTFSWVVGPNGERQVSHGLLDPKNL